jgi:Arc/MetJ-type ribon-helix-helix transcriptional regulator
MGQAKKSVTLDSDLVVEIEQLVGAGGFSAFVNEGARMRLTVERGRAAVSAFEEEHGPISDEALARVDAQWPG